MRKTTPEKQQAEAEARQLLEQARALRETRVRILRFCFSICGDHGPLISGIEREHFPETAKDALRANARAIGDAVEQSLKMWLQSGRRRSTWLPLKDAAHVDGCRY